jgi:hypothetical protein
MLNVSPRPNAGVSSQLSVNTLAMDPGAAYGTQRGQTPYARAQR